MCWCRKGGMREGWERLVFPSWSHLVSLLVSLNTAHLWDHHAPPTTRCPCPVFVMNTVEERRDNYMSCLGLYWPRSAHVRPGAEKAEWDLNWHMAPTCKQELGFVLKIWFLILGIFASISDYVLINTNKFIWVKIKLYFTLSLLMTKESSEAVTTVYFWAQ